MRAFEKIFEETELVHHLERGRMNRVTAKVAQKIRVFLQDYDVDPGARQQKPKHHSRRPTPGNAASSVYRFGVSHRDTEATEIKKQRGRAAMKNFLLLCLTPD